MYFKIITDFNVEIEAEIIKTKHQLVYYKFNLSDKKWQSVEANSVKLISIRDHSSEHPGHF